MAITRVIVPSANRCPLCLFLSGGVDIFELCCICRAPVAAVKLLRDVGTVTGDVVRSEAIGVGYVFTVDNFLKMLSITLRLEVKRVLGILGVSRPTQTYPCTFSYGAMYRRIEFSFDQ